VLDRQLNLYTVVRLNLSRYKPVYRINAFTVYASCLCSASTLLLVCNQHPAQTRGPSVTRQVCYPLYVSMAGHKVYCFFSIRLQISRRRWHHRREILNDGTCTYRSRTGFLPFWGRYPRKFKKSKISDLNFGHLTANRGLSKTVN